MTLDSRSDSRSKIFARRIALSALAGILAGLSAAIFLHSLAWATQTHLRHPRLLLLLPLAGLMSGLAYHFFGRDRNRDIERGPNLILDTIHSEAHSPQATIPARMAPLVLFGTLLTHLFGGSAGREGTAVQMGASLADQLARFFKIAGSERKALLMAGMGAGFGAAIGAPIAGAIFGLEVLTASGIHFVGILECVIGSFTGFAITRLLHAPHSHFPSIALPASLDAKLVLALLASGLAFGIAARIFVALTHAAEFTYRKLRVPTWLRPVIGGVLFIAIFPIGTRFGGLGIPTIQMALTLPVDFTDPALKAVATALTVGCGFKGGEFVPLVFIGTTLGSALSRALSATAPFLGALGFSAVFGAAANTPIACAAMAAEIFGAGILPYALTAGVVAYLCSGPSGIYSAQLLRSVGRSN